MPLITRSNNILDMCDGSDDLTFTAIVLSITIGSLYNIHDEKNILNDIVKVCTIVIRVKQNTMHDLCVGRPKSKAGMTAGECTISILHECLPTALHSGACLQHYIQVLAYSTTFKCLPTALHSGALQIKVDC